MKYNVFISSKSEDYHLAEQVYNFLKQKGLKVFLASRELDQIGEAQYASAIDEAIDNTTHMIVVASSIDNINSRWVKHEWGTFSSDLKSGFRSGNLLNVLTNDLQIMKLPPSLRHNQTFTFDNYMEHILSYLKEDESQLAAKLAEAKREISLLRASLSEMKNEMNALQNALAKEKITSQERLETIKALTKKSSENDKKTSKQSDGYTIRITNNYLEVMQVQLLTQVLNNYGISVTRNQILYSLSHLEPCVFNVSLFSTAVKIKKAIENIGITVVIENKLQY